MVETIDVQRIMVSSTSLRQRRRRAFPISSSSSCMLVTASLFLIIATRSVVVSLHDDDSSTSATTSTTTPTTTNLDDATTTPHSNEKSTKIFTNINDNYQSSSTSLDAVTKKIEEDIKERQMKMREYWQQTFEEIKASNPVVFPPESELSEDDAWITTMQRWKLFSDSGSNGSVEGSRNSAMGEVQEEAESVVDGDDSSPDDGEDAMTSNNLSKSRILLPTPPLRFDGFQTWEKQLQQWSEDVSLYLAETESQLNELLQPKEPLSTYDMSSFGVSSESLKKLIRVDGDGDEDNNDEEDLVASIAEEESGNDEEEQPSSSSASTPNPTKRSLSQRLGLISSTVTSPIGTLPIALTNFDRTLPTIPKPRPITSSDTILPHTDIGDKSKNIWIVTTGALPWMTGTAVNPLLRAAYLSNGRREAGGSVTLMLPWVERPSDQKRIYGSENRFATPEDQEEYIRGWLRDTANMKMASEELNIRWYTAWQEVLENSLYSMGDIIGLIPVSIFATLYDLSPYRPLFSTFNAPFLSATHTGGRMRYLRLGGARTSQLVSSSG